MYATGGVYPRLDVQKTTICSGDLLRFLKHDVIIDKELKISIVWKYNESYYFKYILLGI